MSELFLLALNLFLSFFLSILYLLLGALFCHLNFPALDLYFVSDCLVYPTLFLALDLEFLGLELLMLNVALMLHLVMDLVLPLSFNFLLLGFLVGQSVDQIILLVFRGLLLSDLLNLLRVRLLLLRLILLRLLCYFFRFFGGLDCLFTRFSCIFLLETGDTLHLAKLLDFRLLRVLEGGCRGLSVCLSHGHSFLVSD